MFRLDSGQVYHAEALEQLTWLEHGFGTRLSPHWPAAPSVATLRQIHSNKVLVAALPGQLGEGDAMISNTPGVALAIRTADCLPILMADPRNRAIAAVHAGWRGTVQEIVGETIVSMGRHFGTRPDELVIAIGPGIGGCCYRVGPEVAGRLASFFPERTDLNTTTTVDLAETTRRQLRRYGGSVGQIDPSGLCTYCLPDSFHSYRRDREAAGRMVSSILIR